MAANKKLQEDLEAMKQRLVGSEPPSSKEKLEASNASLSVVKPRQGGVPSAEATLTLEDLTSSFPGMSSSQIHPDRLYEFVCRNDADETYRPLIEAFAGELTMKQWRKFQYDIWRSGRSSWCLNVLRANHEWHDCETARQVFWSSICEWLRDCEHTNDPPNFNKVMTATFIREMASYVRETKDVHTGVNDILVRLEEDALSALSDRQREMTRELKKAIEEAGGSSSPKS